MSDILKKRFWKEVSVGARETGFTVLLDGREIKTPAKSPVLIPSKPLAAAVAVEWDAVEGKIDPADMPMTRRVNAAIDKVAPQRAAIAAMLASYGESDLLCYRANFPEQLVARQAKVWGYYLDGARQKYGVELGVTSGVMPLAQDREAVAVLGREINDLGTFQLTGFHDLVTHSGSLVLGLAAIAEKADISAIWQAACLDEIWQAEQWGADEEATETLALKQLDFSQAHRFFLLAEGT